jgi:plasmid stability protein
MAQLLIRDLDPSVVDKIKTRALKHGRSLQGELKSIIEEAACASRDARRLAANVRRKFQGRQFDDSAALIAHDRDR